MCPAHSFVSGRVPPRDTSDCSCSYDYQVKLTGLKASCVAKPRDRPGYVCPDNSYISASHWPITSFADCKCEWAYIREDALEGCRAPTKTQAEIDAGAGETTLPPTPTPPPYHCPANAHVASGRYPISSFDECACNAGYFALGSTEACMSITPAPLANTYTCPENSYISTDAWPLEAFGDCTCSWGFARTEDDFCAPPAVAKKKARPYECRMQGTGIAQFMAKARDFKRAVAKACGVGVAGVVIDDVVPLSTARKQRRRRLAAGGVSVSYSVVSGGASTPAELIQQGLDVTADFSGATTSAVGSEAPPQPAAGPGEGGVLGVGGVIGIVAAAAVALAAATVVAHRRNGARRGRNSVAGGGAAGAPGTAVRGGTAAGAEIQVQVL